MSGDTPHYLTTLREEHTMDNQIIQTTLITIATDLTSKTGHLMAWVRQSQASRMVSLIGSNHFTDDGKAEVVASLKALAGTGQIRTTFKRGLTRAFFTLTGGCFVIKGELISYATAGKNERVNEHGEIVTVKKVTPEPTPEPSIISEGVTTGAVLVKDVSAEQVEEVRQGLQVEFSEEIKDLRSQANEANNSKVKAEQTTEQAKSKLTTAGLALRKANDRIAYLEGLINGKLTRVKMIEACNQ